MKKETIKIEEVPVWHCVTENADQEELRQESRKARFSPHLIKSRKEYGEKFKYQMIKAVALINKGASVEEAASRVFDSSNPALFDVIKEYVKNEK